MLRKTLLGIAAVVLMAGAENLTDQERDDEPAPQ